MWTLKTSAVIGAFALLATACDKGDADKDDTDVSTWDTDTTVEDTDVEDDTDVAPTCQTDICVTYGAAVPTVASDIVNAAAVDPEFSDAFAPLVARGDEAVADFKTSLANFISDAYGCTTDAYTGPSMPAAHAGMNITQDEYDDFIGLIAGVLADDGVAADDINLCFAPPLVATSFSSTIVGK